MLLQPRPHRLMLGIVAEVAIFMWVRLQVPEHRAEARRVDIFEPAVEDHEQPALVGLAAEGAAGIQHGIVVFGDGDRPPVQRPLPPQQGFEGPALDDVARHRAAEMLDEGRREVDGLDEGVAGRPARGVSLRRGVDDDQRHLDRDLVEQVLLAEPVVAEIVAMVGGEDDHGLVREPLLVEELEQHAELVVDLADEAHIGGMTRRRTSSRAKLRETRMSMKAP